MTLEQSASQSVSFFDRHGIMGLLFAVFVQTAGIIWWASTLTNKVGDLQNTVERQQETQNLMATTISQNADRLTRVQTVQESVVKLLDRHIEVMEERFSQRFSQHGTDPYSGYGGPQRGPRVNNQE